MQTTDSATPAHGATIGWVDEPRGLGVVGPHVRVSGWALAATGIRAIEVRLDGQAFRARYGMRRDDVAAARPGYPGNPNGGFAFAGDVSACPAPHGVDRRTLSIVAIAGDGTETELGYRSLVEPSAHLRWRFPGVRSVAPFYLIPALSGVASGGAFALEHRYTAFLSPTTRIGMRVPILYLRTTAGPGGDYRFDPDFDVRRRQGLRAVADDSLSQVLAHAREASLPVLITLNGGIWADASGTCAEWDVNDRLEEEPANCQWNERDEVMPDDHLKHLPGSQQAPELARALTLNVYARAVREYKRRNLQQAAEPLVRFMQAHPELVIGVNLDPDVYINPFFTGMQWYDYNPGTLVQFRHWLAGSGPYAGDAEAGIPDLSSYRRSEPLTLDAASALAKRPFADWASVDPPRVFANGGEHPHWNDPWAGEWEVFRRHLVKLHYDELAQWLADAGVPRDRIWSSQGLDAPSDVHAPPGGFMPLALYERSPPRNFDSGGVSIEGSKPRDGHLGAIVYGAAATNDIPMENGRSLYATLAAFDPDFGIVEFNTADLRHPERRPTYADAYRALRDLWNCGARFVSPMAWNGANGVDAGTDGYVAFTAWRNTPLERATCDFLLARSGLPRGARLWTFGTHVHADDDRWRVDAGSLRSRPGALELHADAFGRIVLVSPDEVALAVGTIDAVVVGLDDAAAIDSIVIDVRSARDAPWHPLVHVRGGDCERSPAGLLVRCTPAACDIAADQVRLTLALGAGAPATLRRVAILRGA